MSNKNINQNNKNYNTQEYQHDSLFSIWQNNNFYHKSDLSVSQPYFDNNSIFGSSALSLKSMQIGLTPQDGFQSVNTNRDLDTISLTDMLKTNCSHQDFNSISRIEGFNKFSNFDLSIGKNRQNQILEEDGLELVSNRKLQNRVNAKRARQKKKVELDQMKQMIDDLQAENLMLKQSIKIKQAENKNNKYGSYAKNQNQRYCKRCKKQIFFIPGCLQTQLSINNQAYNKNKPNKLGLAKYIKISSKTKQTQIDSEQSSQNIEEQINYKNIRQGQIEQQIKQKQDDELIFEEIDFGNLKYSNNQNFEQINQKKLYKNKKKQNRWAGKIWIALGILMMIIGMQIHGLEGSGEKSIRISEKQTKRWLSDFDNESVTGFTIKMKTKIPGSFVQNQKDQKVRQFQKQKDKWSKKFHKNFNQRKIKTQEYEQRQPTYNQFSNWQDYLSFEPQQIYSRNMANQQEDQIEIDKDLLYSIHAQFDDIGRYI